MLVLVKFIIYLYAKIFCIRYLLENFIAAIFYVERVAVLTMTLSYVRTAMIVYLDCRNATEVCEKARPA